MAVSIFSTADLILISQMTTDKLQMFVDNRSVRNALILRRNLQISLTHYSNVNPSRGGRLDMVQAKIISIIKLIETAARNAYTIHKWRDAKKKNPVMTEREKIIKKKEIKRSWERFIAGASF